MSQNKQHEEDDKQGAYPENGNNFKAGREDIGALPNNPAKNEELTSPEGDEQPRDKHKSGEGNKEK